jgi:YD repeat-containing protein
MPAADRVKGPPMRASCLVLLALTPAGCSMLIADSGQNLSQLATRAEVREAFGPPTATTEPDADVYETRRKIAEPSRGVGALGFPWLVSCGAAELVLFPHELYVNARRVAAGQTLRFTYDADGNVESIRLNGTEQASVGHVPRP